MSTTRTARPAAAAPPSDPAHVSGARSRAAATAPPGPSVRELAIAWLVLTVVGVAAYAANIRDGGFSTDDWSNAAMTLQAGGVGDVLSSFVDLTSYRPVLILYVPATYWVFGTHMGLHLAWAVALGIFVSGTLYGVLRSSGLQRLHALPIAALVLVYPWVDSTRMWATASMASLAIGLALAGIWVAIVGLRRGSGRVHAAAVGLYLLSALTYELTVGLIAGAGFLYLALAGWRAARLRWAADLVAMAAVAVWNFSTTPRSAATQVSALLDHLESIVVEGGTLLAHTAVPLSSERKILILLALFGVLAAAVALALASRPGSALGASLRRWLILFGAGAAVVALGWAPLIPADAYYTPSIYGSANRVNALASIGLVIVVYALAGMVGAMVGSVRSRTPVVAAAVTLTLAAALGVGYLKVLDRHSDLWVGAFRGQMSAIGQIKTQYPELPDGSIVHTFGYPGYQAPSVPVFAVSWDLNAALKLQYQDGDVGGYPIFEPSTVRCEAAGVVAEGGPAFSETRATPFGRAILLDVPSGRTVRPRDLRECRRSLPEYRRGPLQLQGTY